MSSSVFTLSTCLLLTFASAGQAECGAADPAGCMPAAADEVSMLQRVHGGPWGGTPLVEPYDEPRVWEETYPGCGGHGAYPNLEGALYNWTSYQLAWQPSNSPMDAALRVVPLQPFFSFVKFLTGEPATGPVVTGPFLYLRFADPLLNSTGRHLCVLDTKVSVTCITSAGGPLGRFVFSGGLTPTCTPRNMVAQAGPLLTAGGAVGVWTGPLVLAGIREGAYTATGQVVVDAAAPVPDQTGVEGEVAAASPAAAAGAGKRPGHHAGCAAGHFPVLAGNHYSVTSRILRNHATGGFEDQTSGPELATFDADRWNFSFFDNINLGAGTPNQRNQFVQLNINSGERWALCAFEDALEPGAAADFFLSCTLQPESRFLVRLAIMRADLDARTCVPKRLSLSRGCGSLLHPAAHRAEPVREVAVLAGTLHLDSDTGRTAQEGAAAEGGEKSATSGSRHPTLAGHKYAWTSQQLVGMSDQPGNMSVAVQRQTTAEFFNQVGKAGRFVQVRLKDDSMYSYEASCQFEDELTLSCVDTAEGLLFHRFQVASESMNAVTGVPGRLTELRFGSLAVRGSTARQAMLAIGNMAWTR